MGKLTSATTQVSRPRTQDELVQAEAALRARFALAHEDDEHPADVLRDVRVELMELRTLKASVTNFVQDWIAKTGRKM